MCQRPRMAFIIGVLGGGKSIQKAFLIFIEVFSCVNIGATRSNIALPTTVTVIFFKDNRVAHLIIDALRSQIALTKNRQRNMAARKMVTVKNRLILAERLQGKT